MEEKGKYVTGNEEVEDTLEMLGKGYEPQEIVDESDLRKYRIELPNLYDDAGLDPYEFRLLAHYKRVGTCTESTKTTGTKCSMSPAQVSEKRQALHDKGFIVMTAVPMKGGKSYSYTIAVVDKWRENFERYSTLSRGERTPSLSERPLHSVKQRINHIKKEPTKKKEQGASAPPATSLPEIQLYRSVTNQYPAKASQYTVLVKMNDVQNRLGRLPALDDLMPFYRAWCDRGYNPRAVTWLEWAASGVIPTNGKPVNRNASILADFAERNGLNG